MIAATYFLGVCILLHAILNFVRSMVWYRSRI